MNKKERMEALRNAGINVDSFIAMGLPEGAKVTINLPGGGTQEIEILKKRFKDMDAIKADPYFSRWTMAQVFDVLRSGLSVERYLCRKYDHPYSYQFSQTLDRLKELYLKTTAGSERREILSKFFNDRVAIELASGYLMILHKYIDELKVAHHKGVPYKKIPGFGMGVHCKDIEGVVFRPLEKAYERMKDSMWNNPKRFINAFEDFINHMVKIPEAYLKANVGLNKWFIAAYQGRGAYLTATGLIEFHGCRVYPRTQERYSWMKVKGDKPLSREESLKAVKAKVDETSGIFNVPDTYMLWGMMKELIVDNGFDFYKAMDEKYNG